MNPKLSIPQHTHTRNQYLSYTKRVELAAEREERQEKRGRIENFLRQRLESKLQSRGDNIHRTVLENAIIAYLDAHPNFVGAWTDLKELNIVVDRILPMIGKFVQVLVRQRDSLTRTTLVQSRATASPIIADSTANSAGRSSNETLNTCRGGTADVLNLEKDMRANAIWKGMNPWVKMNIANTIEAEEKELLVKEQKALIRHDVAIELNNQIRRKKEVEEIKREEDDAFVAARKHEVKLWQRNATSEKRLAHEARKRASESIRSQIDACKERKKAEMERCRNREVKEIEKMKAELLEEEERRQEKKVQEKIKWNNIKKENADNLKTHHRMKEVEAALDAKLMVEMKLRLDREDAKRAQAHMDRLQRNETFAKKLRETETYQEGTKKRQEDEKRSLHEMQAKEFRTQEAELRKKKVMKKRQEEIIETNRNMAEAKKRELIEVERSEEEYATKCREEGEAVLAEESAKRQKEACFREEYSKVLKEQIREAEKVKTALMCNMNTAELSINKDIMQKINSDPVLREKIVNKAANGMI